MDIKIMGQQDLVELARKPFPLGTAVISITDSGDPDVVLEHQPHRIVHLKFDDVSDEIFEEILGRKPTVGEMHQIAARFHIISNRQVRLMADFILSSGNMDTLICQCKYGQSRSAAVAAAVMEFFNHKGIQVFADARYYPNKYVFRKLLIALRNGPKSQEGCP